MRDHPRFAREEKRPGGLEADVVVKKDIAPTNEIEQFGCSRLAENLELPLGFILAGRLCEETHFMPGVYELSSQ